MTRFNITLEQGVKLVDFVQKNNSGGEIYVPKLKSFYITELAKAIDIKKKIKVIGIRKGEKLHEELINFEESKNSYQTKDMYILYPNTEDKDRNRPKINKNYKATKKQFSYNSFDNKPFLKSLELKKLILGVKD